MRAIATTMTQRGQVTVPAEVRRRLGLKPKDKVVFHLDGDDIRLTPARFTAATAFASVKPLGGPADFERMIREAKDERARNTVRRLAKP